MRRRVEIVPDPNTGGVSCHQLLSLLQKQLDTRELSLPVYIGPNKPIQKICLVDQGRGERVLFLYE